jgi:2-desacetyl-2-hydroxyethyl bacteriochlorophyllide A dehydrogenase
MIYAIHQQHFSFNPSWSEIMKAAQVHQPNKLEIIDLPIPQPAENELLIQVMASGICGTDIHIFRGEYLGPYPVIPGHEFSGVVAAVGQAITRFKPGDHVAVEPNIACDNCDSCLNNRQNFCLNWQAVGVTRPGGMAQFVTAPEKACFNIGSLPFEEGAFMEPLSCVLHGMQRLSPELAGKLALLGAGPIGCLILQVARLQGTAEITVVEKNRSRLEASLAFGANLLCSSLDELQKDHYDAVIDATGALPVIARSLDFVRPGGKVLWFGVPPSGQTIPIEPFTIFHKGLTVLSSFTSVRNSTQALALLQSGRISAAKLVSHHLSLEEFRRGIESIESGEQGVMKVLIRPNGL